MSYAEGYGMALKELGKLQPDKDYSGTIKLIERTNKYVSSTFVDHYEL